MIVFAVAGADLLNALKQASEFHLAPEQYLATQLPISATSTQPDRRLPRPHLHAILVFGPQRSDARFRQALRPRQRMPNDNQVTLYSSVRHYLEGSPEREPTIPKQLWRR